MKMMFICTMMPMYMKLYILIKITFHLIRRWVLSQKDEEGIVVAEAELGVESESRFPSI